MTPLTLGLIGCLLTLIGFGLRDIWSNLKSFCRSGVAPWADFRREGAGVKCSGPDLYKKNRLPSENIPRGLQAEPTISTTPKMKGTL